MTQLKRHQTLFFDAMRRVPAAASEASTAFVDSPSMSALARLEVYRRSWWARQHHVLSSLFPRVVAHLGRPRFRALANAYLESRPATTCAVESIGACFGDWVAAAEQLPDVAMLARVEFASFEVAIAADVDAVKASAVDASFPTSTLSIGRHVRVITISCGVGHRVAGGRETRRCGRAVGGMARAVVGIAPGYR
jgi:hypothetical protein